jgi:glycerophosphoryl diester phosphodiesterase
MACNCSSDRAFSWLLQKPVAHRGLHDNNNRIPENSMAAFKAAIEQGLPIELDIHQIKTGEIIVFHDDTLTRMTGSNLTVNEASYEEISTLRLSQTDEPIPLLEDVLALVADKVPLLIEIKNRTQPGPLEEKAAALLHTYQGRFAVQAFNPYIVRWFQDHYPHFIRGQLSGSFRDEKDMPLIRKLVLRSHVLNLGIHADFFALEYTELCKPPALVLKALDKPLLAWTVKNSLTYSKVAPHCDNVIFEGFAPWTSSPSTAPSPNR